MLDLILFLGIIGGIFGLSKISQNPLWGIALVIIVTPLEPFIPNLGGFTLGRILGIITTMVWFFYLVSKPKSYIKLQNSTLLRKQLVFLSSVFISGLVWYFEPEGARALSSAFTFLLLGVMALMVENLILEEKDLKLIAFALAISGVFACIPANMYFIGIDLYTPLGVEPPSDRTEETLRATNIGGSPNSLGIMARNGIFGSILLLSLIKKRVNGFVVWAMLLICFSGIILSGSRTNFYGTVAMVGIVFTFGLSRFLFRKAQFIMLIFGFFIIGFFAFQLVPKPVQERLLMGRGTGDEHIAERSSSRYNFTVNQQIQSLEFLSEHPLLGIGLNRTDYKSGVLGAHDTVSTIVGETGLLGITGFLILIFWAIMSLKKILKISIDFSSRLRVSLLLGLLISMLIMGIFGGLIMPYDRTFWMSLALIQPMFLLTTEKNNPIVGINQN